MRPCSGIDIACIAYPQEGSMAWYGQAARAPPANHIPPWQAATTPAPALTPPPYTAPILPAVAAAAAPMHYYDPQRFLPAQNCTARRQARLCAGSKGRLGGPLQLAASPDKSFQPWPGQWICDTSGGGRGSEFARRAGDGPTQRGHLGECCGAAHGRAGRAHAAQLRG